MYARLLQFRNEEVYNMSILMVTGKMGFSLYGVCHRLSFPLILVYLLCAENCWAILNTHSVGICCIAKEKYSVIFKIIKLLLCLFISGYVIFTLKISGRGNTSILSRYPINFQETQVLSQYGWQIAVKCVECHTNTWFELWSIQNS